MHTRRLITFLLGLWFALVIGVATVTTMGSQVAEKIAKTPPGPPARALVVIGEPMTEQIFRFIAAEINRSLSDMSGLAELAVVFAIACLLFFNNYSRTATILAGVLLLAAFASHLLLAPQLVSLGRLADFRQEDAMLGEVERFVNVLRLHQGLVVFRLLCGAWITGILLNRGSNSRMQRRWSKIDAINDSEHGHIDR